MIELAGVSKGYRLPNGDRLDLLRRLSLSAERGEMIAIIGRSGSGKSTLLNLIGLLDRFDVGRYVVNGTDASNLTDRAASRLRGATFGFIFQHFHLLDRRTTLQNVIAPLQHASYREMLEGRGRALDILEEVGLADRALSKPAQLSGGEQQRVAIARSLIRRPTWLLADEPTGSLDPQTASKVLRVLIDAVRIRACGLIVVTHDPQVALLADRRLTLADGILQEMP